MAAIEDMMKKRRKRLDTTESSSSGKMEPLKPPKDVWELGHYLVRELGIEDIDTLGRWMAHHLAELMDQAENGPTLNKRTKARKEAIETILKIWDHRASLPGNSYPLMEYSEVIKAINRLQPRDGLFGFFQRYGEEDWERLAASLFNDFSRLNIALLSLKLLPNIKTGEVDSVAIDALNEAERRVYFALLEWEDFFKPLSGHNRIQKGDRESYITKEELYRLIIKLISSISDKLFRIQAELSGISEPK